MEDLYTIGYGNQSIDTIIDLFKKYEIQSLVDIRTNPYSKFNSDFTKSNLTNHLEKHNIEYIFMGDVLGGMPKDKSLYDSNGKIDYSKIALKPEFKESINRILEYLKNNIRICLMCAELNPQDCHRSELLGEELLNQNIDTKHILDDITIILHSQLDSD